MFLSLSVTLPVPDSHNDHLITSSRTTFSPTRSFKASISPSLTIIISFLTTAEVKETKSLPLTISRFLVREEIIRPTTSGHTRQTSCSFNFWNTPVCRSACSTSSSILFIFPSFMSKRIANIISKSKQRVPAPRFFVRRQAVTIPRSTENKR